MRRANRERGAALMFALMVLAILSIGTSVLWKQIHGNLQQHRVAWHKEQVFQLAEAGLEKGIAQLRSTAGAYQGEEAVALGAGTFTIVVSPSEKRGEYRLLSTGRLENAAYHFDAVTFSASLTLADDGSVTRYVWQRQRGEAKP